MLKKLKELPIPVAAAFLVVCILAGVTLGNRNALVSAAQRPKAEYEALASLALERGQKASNLLVIASRNAPDAPYTKKLAETIESVKNAKSVREVAEANRALTFAATAVEEALSPAVTPQDKKLMTGVMDDLASAEHQLARVAGRYNEAVLEVKTVHGKLPAKWLLRGALPEAYQ